MNFDSNTNKLLILYALDQMGFPVKSDVIEEMMSATDLINSFDCRAALNELISSGQIVNMATKNNTARYTISSNSKEGLAAFYTRIPTSAREKAAAYIKENRTKLGRKQEYLSDYFKNADGTYSVILKIESAEFTLMDLKLIIPDRNKAKWIYKNWATKAPIIYEGIYDSLIMD